MKYIYRWRKARIYKKPSKWEEYEISVMDHYLSLKTDTDEKKINWSSIKQCKIFKVNAKPIYIKITYNNMENFMFGNEFASSITKFEFRNNEFNKIVKLMHEKIANNKNIQFIAGDSRNYHILKYSYIIMKVLFPLMILLGIGMIFKFGNPASLFMGIAIGTFIYADPFKEKKEVEYDPHEVIKKGIRALKL